MSPNSPVILLAYANDHTQGPESRQYLDNLDQEREKVSEILQREAAKGLWQAEILANATADDIRKSFLSFPGRIAVFHFSGHADAAQHCLRLENPERGIHPLPGKALADFLGHQPNLNLIVLNGCNTLALGKRLLDAGVGAVVATTDPMLSDPAAKVFAEHFYSALAENQTLEQAFKYACDSAVFMLPGKMRGIDSYEDSETSEVVCPWQLIYRPGAESLDNWCLLDPLYGLPLPEDIGLPSEPYQVNLLQNYRREDARVFFGRGKIIRQIHDALTNPDNSPIIRFYGQSGVGKSSLLAAGLLPRLEAKFTLVHLARPPHSDLLATVVEAIGDGPDLASAWHQRETNDQCPVLVVLDQVDELLADGQARIAEWHTLLTALEPLFGIPNCRPKGKLLLGFRKEWLAEIDRDLLNHRLPLGHCEFLERLERSGIVEAVEGIAVTSLPQDRWHLRLVTEEGEDNLAQRIANDLLADPNSPVAPTLQILLSRMWQATVKRDRQQPVFDTALYTELSQQGLHLSDFLAGELALLDRQFPHLSKSGLALDLLYEHTTDLSRAAERSQAELDSDYAHCRPHLQTLLTHFKERFLLADPATDGIPPATRLAHDTLAPLVRREHERSNRPGQRARRVLEERAKRVDTALSLADLAVVEKGHDGMRYWTMAEKALIDRSRQKRRWRQGQKAVLVMALTLTSSVGLWGWDTFYRKHVEYYAHFVKRAGFPEGIGPLRLEDTGSRTYYELTRYGRDSLVEEMRLLDGSGQCRLTQSEFMFIGSLSTRQFSSRRLCRYRFEPDIKGNIAKEIAYDLNNQKIYELQYDGSAPVARYVEAGYDKAQANSGAAYVRFVRNADGYETEWHYTDGRRVSQPDKEGCYGWQGTLGGQGLPILVNPCLGADNQPMLNQEGYAKVTFKYDPRGNSTEVAYFDEENHPVLNKVGYAKEISDYDERDRPTETAYFDEQGQLTRIDEGYAKILFHYDEQDKHIETLFFDEQNQPVRHNDGYAKRISYRDKRGRVIEESYLDEQNHPIRHKDGYAKRTVRIYSNGQGDCNETAHFNEQGRATGHSDGYAKIVTCRDKDDNPVEIAFFDEQGRPMRHNGYAKITFRYDERYNRTESAFFDEQGHPIENSNGYARSTATYDEHNKVIDQAFFDKQDKRIE